MYYSVKSNTYYYMIDNPGH